MKIKTETQTGSIVSFKYDDEIAEITGLTTSFAPKQDGTPGITTETGSIVSFDNTDEMAKIESVKTLIGPIQEGSGTPTPTNIRPFSSMEQISLHHNDSVEVIVLGREVYGGTLDVTTGELVINKVLVVFDGTEDWVNNTGNSINLDIADIYQPSNMLGDRYIKSATAYENSWGLLESTDVVGGGRVGTMVTRR